MRLLCNGVALDLEKGATMSFQRVNPLFAFDKISCERTQAFKLPDTPTNDRVLALAKLPAYDGRGMRRRFDAEYQDGLVVKRGYLYIDKYESGHYNAIFVTGELVGLQSIKDAGKVSDIVTCNEVVLWDYGPIPNLPARATDTWNIVRYNQLGEYTHPSYLLKAIIDKTTDALDMARISLPDEVAKVRVIVSKLKSLRSTPLQFGRDFSSQYTLQVAPPYPIVNTATLSDVNLVTIFDMRFHNQEYRIHRQNPDQSWTIDIYRGQVAHFRPLQPIRMTFPADFPEDVYIGRFSGSGFYEAAFEFFGERSFHYSAGRIVRDGLPLAGRTVELSMDDDFVFVRESDYTYSDEPSDLYYKQGWQVNNLLNASVTIEGNDIVFGSFIRLQDNLPELTLVELLKTVAAISGKALNYTDDEGITFDDLDTSTWQRIEVRQHMGIKSLARKFGDYAQRNVINFDSDDTVPEVSRIERVYTVDNDNIEPEMLLYTLPFSEGRGVSEIEVALENEKPTIADANTTGKTMVRVSLPENANLQTLCLRSTTIVVRVRMSAYEYNEIKPKTCILLNGTLYVWTDARWSKGVAELTLAKIG